MKPHRVEVQSMGGIHVRRHLCDRCALAAIAVARTHPTTIDMRVAPDPFVDRIELYPRCT